ncbi:hypothetical protein ACA910_002919 [Epithemia clementina (nom. ined.)]
MASRIPWRLIDSKSSSNNNDTTGASPDSVAPDSAGYSYSYDGNCACRRQEAATIRIVTNKLHFKLSKSEGSFPSFVCPNCGGIQVDELVASLGSGANSVGSGTSSVGAVASLNEGDELLTDSSLSTLSEYNRTRVVSVDSSTTLPGSTCSQQGVGMRGKNSRPSKVSTGQVQKFYIQPQGDTNYTPSASNGMTPHAVYKTVQVQQSTNTENPWSSSPSSSSPLR